VALAASGGGYALAADAAPAAVKIPAGTLHGCVSGSTRVMEHVYESNTSRPGRGHLAGRRQLHRHPDENTTGGVFPQLFVCDGAANARFTNDLFNVGAGALENPTSTIVSDGDTINGGRSPWNQASPGWDRYRRISRRRCSQSPTLCLQSARVCAN
jgi:hypothetical protein